MTESGEPQAGPANRSDQPARRLLLLLLGGVAGSAIGVAVALFGGSGRSAGTNITIGVAVGLVATIAITVLLQRQVGGFMALSGMARLRDKMKSAWRDA